MDKDCVIKKQLERDGWLVTEGTFIAGETYFRYCATKNGDDFSNSPVYFGKLLSKEEK